MSEPSLDVFVEALPPTLQLDYGVRAEERGFRAAWFPEITFGDAFGPATAVATRTSRLGLGTGVVGIWSRSAVTLALQAATLNELSNGRLLLGVGLQARGYVEGWQGQTYERPVRAMKEYVTILRRILAGENVTFEGEIFSVRNFQLQMQPPERPVRIYMAAIGPQMTRLAGELADGIIGYFYSAEYVRETVLPNLSVGAERAGRTLDDFDIACGFPTIVTPYGLAAVIVLITLAPTTEVSLMLTGVVYFILFLDWLAMLTAHIIVRWLGPLLMLFGVILGVTQVALGLQLILAGISGLIAQGDFTAPGN